MKNITLSADEHLIERARGAARARHKTLNDMFREWLEQIASPENNVKKFDEMMKRLKHVKITRKYTREEMNER